MALCVRYNSIHFVLALGGTKVVVDSPSKLFDSDLCPAEQWFQHLAESLRLLAPALPSELIKSVLSAHLPKRVERVLPRLQDPENAQEWLNLILKSRFLIRLWRSSDEPVVVALSVSGSLISAKEQLHLIESSEFRDARKGLGIAKHWFLIIPGSPPVGPSRDELLDALYDQLAVEEECSIVEFGDCVARSC